MYVFIYMYVYIHKVVARHFDISPLYIYAHTFSYTRIYIHIHVRIHIQMYKSNQLWHAGRFANDSSTARVPT